MENDLLKFRISSSLHYLQNISKNKFKKEVMAKAETYFFNLLLRRKNSHSKMRNVKYKEFKIQPYFLRADLSNESIKTLFKWRTKMSKFSNNYRGGRPVALCPLCRNHDDLQEDSFKCYEIRQKITINHDYEDIFNPLCPDLPGLIETLSNIMRIRNQHGDKS